MTTRIPAAKVAQIHAALTAAITRVDRDMEANDAALWAQLLDARAVVQVYLLDAMPALEVEVTPAQREAA